MRLSLYLCVALAVALALTRDANPVATSVFTARWNKTPDRRGNAYIAKEADGVKM